VNKHVVTPCKFSKFCNALPVAPALELVPTSVIKTMPHAAAVPYRPSYLWIASSEGEAGETPDATSLIVDRIHKLLEVLLEVQQPEEALKICDRAIFLFLMPKAFQCIRTVQARIQASTSLASHGYPADDRC